MTIGTVILLLLLYRAYTYYRKHNDKEALLENRRLYMNEFYHRHFFYYRMLQPEEQQIFITRALETMGKMEFINGGDLWISENIKLLLGATFTQITFGLDDESRQHFHKILLPQSVFHSQWVVSEGNMIKFKSDNPMNWNNFIQGYMFPSEKINLAINELSRAIQHELFEQHVTFSEEYRYWKKTASEAIEKIKESGGGIYFNKHNALNTHDFFAACIIFYFEDAVAFSEQWPVLYAAMAALLRQDLAARMLVHSVAHEAIN